MKLFTKQQYTRLLKNGQDAENDHVPVIKLFTPDANWTWLISEIMPDEVTAFGLCDGGMGFPELGYTHLPDIREIRGCLGLPVERDMYFEGKFPITIYAEAARLNQAITLDEISLLQAQSTLTKGVYYA
nr:single-stranded DNA endonuclease [bacterium]